MNVKQAFEYLVSTIRSLGSVLFKDGQRGLLGQWLSLPLASSPLNTANRLPEPAVWTQLSEKMTEPEPRVWTQLFHTMREQGQLSLVRHGVNKGIDRSNGWFEACGQPVSRALVDVENVRV